MLTMCTAEGFSWYCSAGCLHWVTGRLQTVLDAVPQGRHLAGVLCLFYTIQALLYYSLREFGVISHVLLDWAHSMC